jgi:hypothetical protein
MNSWVKIPGMEKRRSLQESRRGRQPFCHREPAAGSGRPYLIGRFIFFPFTIVPVSPPAVAEKSGDGAGDFEHKTSMPACLENGLPSEIPLAGSR